MKEGRPADGLPNAVPIPAFGIIEPERVLAQDDLFVVVWDKHPVSPRHTLIIARRAGCHDSREFVAVQENVFHRMKCSVKRPQPFRRSGAALWPLLATVAVFTASASLSV